MGAGGKRALEGGKPAAIVAAFVGLSLLLGCVCWAITVWLRSVSPEGKCRTAVREKLRDPSSAEFTDPIVLKAGPHHTLVANFLVRASNAVGGKASANFTCVYSTDVDEAGAYSLAQEMDGGVDPALSIADPARSGPQP